MRVMTDAAFEAATNAAVELAMDNFKHIIYPLMLVSALMLLIAGHWLGYAKGTCDNQRHP